MVAIDETTVNPNNGVRMKTYEKSMLNSVFYSDKQNRLEDYFKSVTHFFTPEFISHGDSVLDIGGASGGFLTAINAEVNRIRGTVIDPDPRAVELGYDAFHEIEFIEGEFPEAVPQYRKFDIVSMQALLPQIPDWKSMLLQMAGVSMKYINVMMILRLSGTTVVDKDVSYVYYFDTGVRVHQVVHNIYEFVNFLSIGEMRAKKIQIYGYHTPYSGDNFRCLPNSEQVKANAMIELWDEEENPFRMGAAHDKGKGNEKYVFYRPEVEIIIDDEKFNFP